MATPGYSLTEQTEWCVSGDRLWDRVKDPDKIPIVIAPLSTSNISQDLGVSPGWITEAHLLVESFALLL